MDEIFVALADTNRRMIIEYLRSGEMSAGAIASKFSIAREGVSKHLRILLAAGLVSVKQEGRSRVYRLEPETFKELDRWMDPYRRFWEQRLDALTTEIQRGKRSPASTAPQPCFHCTAAHVQST